jgi:fucose 4-O-acetylase-like acetyltransferase
MTDKNYGLLPPRIMDGDLSSRIHSLRFLLMVLVVYIHNNVLGGGINFASGTMAFDIPGYVGTIDAAVQAIVRIAVPLFFLISGYLLYLKMPTFAVNLKKKCRTILLPYLLWTALILLFYLAAQSISITKPYFASILVRNFGVADWIGVVTGHAGQFPKMPMVFQFWFIRDLFILNILFTAIRKAVDCCPGGIFILTLLLWIGNTEIYIVNTGALFFFTLGYYIVKYDLDYRRLEEIRMRDAGIMYGITIIASMFFRDSIPALGAINILVGIMFFLKLSGRFVKSPSAYRLLSWLEKYSFWLYATHVILLASMVKISMRIMPPTGIWLLANYFLVTLLCIIILVAAGAIIRRAIPKIFSILTGGR